MYEKWDNGYAEHNADTEDEELKFKVVLKPCPEDGGYTVSVPSLPGCISEGDTVEEAMANIREAIDIHLDVSLDGLPEGRLEELTDRGIINIERV